jgi:excisionase family DNA binding protein
MKMDSPLLNLEELAGYIGVSKATVYRYLKQKKLPAIKMGRLWKFRKEAIDEWLKRQERA